MEKIAVFGLGYVGCVTAACLARDHHQVIGVDLQPDKVDAVNRGCAPLVEPELPEMLLRGVREQRLRATDDAAAAVAATSAAIICVGTPTGADERPDLRALAAVAEQIGRALRGKSDPYTVIVRSTVPPGTTEGLVAETLSLASGRRIGSGAGEIMLLTLPEFLREATAIRDYDDPPFFVVGGELPASDRAEQLVSSLFGRFESRLVWVSFRTAELLKNVCNAYHAVKVVFANEVGALCQSVGIDGIELMQVFCLDHKLNISEAYLRPGLPFGGSCLPKDLRALVELSRQYGVAVPQLSATLRSNELHVDRAIDAIQAIGRRRIGLEGLSFKPGTDDIRESPMVAIAERLLGRGYDLRIYDPVVYRSAVRSRSELAHLGKRMVNRRDRFLRHAEVLVRGRSSADLLARARDLGLQPAIIDLGRPAYRVAALRHAAISDIAPLPEPSAAVA